MFVYFSRSENYSIHSHDSLNSRLSSGSKTQAFGIYVLHALL